MSAPVGPESYPLGQDDLDGLNQVLSICAQQQSLFEKAKECGLVIDEHEQVNKGQMDIAMKIKQQFFPNAR